MSRYPLAPEHVGALASNLSETIAKFRRWDVRVLDVNRLERGRRMLEDVARNGAYPSDTSKLRLIGAALADALEFRYISHAMPEERLEILTKDLQKSVGGTLMREGSREAYQFQTQFWVGAVIGLAGVTPIIPPPRQTKSPDYFIQNGTIYYGVEVKRPSSVAGAERALKDAARQLAAANVSGAIVIDVSDCIAPDAFELVDSPLNSTPPAWEGEFRRIAEKLEGLAFDDERRQVRPEFFPATVMLITANVCRWNLSDLRHPDLKRLCRFGCFFRVNQRNLAYHRAVWLQDVLYKGIQAAGHEVVAA
jgi:hypothetical protein